MKEGKILTVVLVLVGLLVFVNQASAKWEYVYAPNGKIIAYKDPQTGYHWWSPGAISYIYSAAEGVCRAYYGGSWYASQAWKLPTESQIKNWYSHGGLDGMGASSCRWWVNSAIEYQYSSDNGYKGSCAKEFTTCSGGAQVIWTLIDNGRVTLCVYTP